MNKFLTQFRGKAPITPPKGMIPFGIFAYGTENKLETSIIPGVQRALSP